MSTSYTAPRDPLAVRRLLSRKLGLPSVCRRVLLEANKSSVEYSTMNDVTCKCGGELMDEFERWNVVRFYSSRNFASVPLNYLREFQIRITLEATRVCNNGLVQLIIRSHTPYPGMQNGHDPYIERSTVSRQP